MVGASGSGKSTVSLLLPRFYDVTRGAVLVGGHDVRELTTDSLRAAIGLVREDSFLFSDTVRDNIAYGRPTAPTSRSEAAARAAQADRLHRRAARRVRHHRRRARPDPLRRQRQRIALARALLTDPRLLVLDDATSAVDARVEHEIHEALRSVMRGRTTLLIAHRRSTLNLADRIAVLEDGRLADIGTHEELQRSSPLYRRLLTDPDELGAVSPGPRPPRRAARDDTSVRDELDAEYDAEPGHHAPAVGRRRADPRDAALAGTPGHPGAARAAPRRCPRPTERPRRRRGAGGPAEESYGLRRLLRRLLRRPLLISLALVAVDAGMGLLLPVLIRHGIDDGVTRVALGAVWAAVAAGPVSPCSPSGRRRPARSG
ncbi:ABC transporter ATP-binding protein OS=Streptomyces fumanus OX=67302 GN=GCM10018772_06270 PE=4 SV=1 [Streptomyces fumanus]